jgi:hypothetical protein
LETGPSVAKTEFLEIGHIDWGKNGIFMLISEIHTYIGDKKPLPPSPKEKL